MKTIGIIGGMSWLSTQEYYSYINRYVAQKLGGLHSAQIIMSSVNFQEVEPLQRQLQWEQVGHHLLAEAKKLEQIGADFILICSVTGNECVTRLQAFLDIPILHIADALAQEILKSQINTVALLGTRYTMEKDFFKSRLENPHEIRVCIPNAEEIEIIQSVIYDELCCDVVKNESRDKIMNIIYNIQNRYSLKA